MADINNILEAEQTIRNIASELEKMKTAANLLDASKTKTEEVIKASESIVAKMKDFVTQGAEIVNKIGDYDIQAEMKTLMDYVEGIESILDSRFAEFEKKNATKYSRLMLLSGINFSILLVLLIKLLIT